MSDLNDIFGYKVYRPPLEELPVIEDLNCYGEVVTQIDPDADVIKDPTVQALLETLDGDRTIRVEDMAPDMRYDGWNQKVEYDPSVVKMRRDTGDLRPREPILNQTVLPANDSGTRQFSIHAARPEVEQELTELRRRQETQHQQFVVKQQKIQEQQRIDDERRHRAFLEQQAKSDAEKDRLVKEQQYQYQQQAILYQLKQQHQLVLAREKLNQPASPEQQVIIQRLLLQLAQLNPQLALQALQQFKGKEPSPPAQAQNQQQFRQQQQQQQQQQQYQQQQAQKARNGSQNESNQSGSLVHSMGSVLTSEPAEFSTHFIAPGAIRPIFSKAK